jgi:hypothetical protein
MLSQFYLELLAVPVTDPSGPVLINQRTPRIQRKNNRTTSPDYSLVTLLLASLLPLLLLSLLTVPLSDPFIPPLLFAMLDPLNRRWQNFNRFPLIKPTEDLRINTPDDWIVGRGLLFGGAYSLGINWRKGDKNLCVDRLFRKLRRRKCVAS